MHKLFAALLLSPTLLAQNSTLVVPPDLATKPGNGLDQQPLGRDRIRHAQFVDRYYLRALGSSATISAIKYRREENRLDKVYSNREPMRRTSSAAIPIPNWQIRVGNFAGQLKNVVPEYANRVNLTTWTTVFAGQLNYTSNTPTLTAPPSAAQPAPFAINFPFNVQPFSYTGRGLAVEHFAYASRNLSHNYFVDAVESRAPAGGDVSLISANTLGCPPNMNRIHGTAPNPGGGDVALQLFGAPANTQALCWFGGNATSWNGAPLPLGLGFMGLSGCNIYTDWSVPVAMQTDAAGISEFRAAVPALASLAGRGFYNQWAVLDPRVNPSTGFATSDGMRVTFGSQIGAPSIQMLVISGENNFANLRYGYLQPGRGAVFQLVY